MKSSDNELVLITGSTDGIGYETARILGGKGFAVLLHGRDSLRAQTARQKLQQDLNRELPAPVLGDFSSLASVRDMVAELDTRDVHLDVLINNAGTYQQEFRRSPDGFELTMAINHFAPFLLTHLLLRSPSGRGMKRIVNVSSTAHNQGNIALDDIAGVNTPFHAYAAYTMSKLANVLTTVELAKRLAPRSVAVNALHPGVVSTKLLRDGFGVDGPDSLEDGAATSVYLASDPAAETISGRYFVRSQPAPVQRIARDETFARAFYERSAEAVGVEPLPLA